MTGGSSPIAARDKWGRIMGQCTYDGCGTVEALRRGLCGKHYMRWWKHGDPSIVLRQPAQHGTTGMYSNHGCRCDDCKRANNIAQKEYQYRVNGMRPAEVVFAERRAAAEARDNHGTETRYKLGCRCSKCVQEATDARRRRRHARSTQVAA